MKKSQLKALVGEIVKTYTEMNQKTKPGNGSWTQNGDEITLEDLELPDGRLIGATVFISGEWDDGAFDHEFGTHRYPLRFNVEDWSVNKVWDMTTDQEIPLDQEINKNIDDRMSDLSSEISQTMEPPESGPDPDDQRDRDIDREFDR